MSWMLKTRTYFLLDAVVINSDGGAGAKESRPPVLIKSISYPPDYIFGPIVISHLNMFYTRYLTVQTRCLRDRYFERY
jgi:hypothetical protein